MKYNLTEKLKFEDNPKLIIKNVELEIKADAVTMLKILAIMQENGEMEAVLKAKDLLFSATDKKKIDALNLKISDYTTLLETAISLALGEDPDEEQGEAETRTTI